MTSSSGEPRPGRRSGEELREIMLTVEELLGSELSGTELAELVNAADPIPKPERD
jgi:hypothetical protein